MCTGPSVPRELENYPWTGPLLRFSMPSKTLCKFASTRFLCYGKLSSKRWRRNLWNAHPALRARYDDQFLRQSALGHNKSPRNLVHCERRAENYPRISNGTPAGRTAAEPWIDGREGRMWRGRMWVLCGFDGWHTRKQLSRSRPSGTWSKHSHYRGHSNRHTVQRPAGIVSEMRRCTVRHFYSGNDSRRLASSQQKSSAHSRPNKRRTFRQSLPVHLLHANLHSHCQSRAPRNGFISHGI